MSLPSEIVIEVMTADVLERDASWWRIYDEAFPIAEREPREVILASVRLKVGLAIRAVLAGQTVGLATAHLLTNPAAVFLVYLATAEGVRGRGIGERLFNFVGEVGSKASPTHLAACAGMIWEVEDPEDASDASERKYRQRRILFFERLGGVVLSRPYQQPPLHGGSAVPMRLMYHARSIHPVPCREELDALVRAIYVEKYHRMNGIPLQVLSQLSGEDLKAITRASDPLAR